MDEKDAAKAEFRRVMSYATDRALNDGLAEEVMAALFDVFDGWAQRTDAVPQGTTG